VLILSEEFDPTVDAVLDELHGRGVEVFRADTSWFPARMSLEAQLTDGRWQGALVTEHHQIALERLTSAWYRRPTMFQFPAELSEPERRHALWEAKLGVGGVLAELQLLWVNHPSREADAAYKPVQLALAARCGLAVPPTLITNRPDAVARFARAHNKQLVIKTLAHASICEQGVSKAIHTHPLTVGELTDLAGIETTAHLLQRAITNKVFEARLTAVGRHLFTAAIHTDSAAGLIDWRADYPSLRWSVIEPPTPVTQGVRRFMKEFGLVFAAFDFAVDTDGVWWFFEFTDQGLCCT
jgi:ATP-grasp ribosomal peptide maturase